MVTELNASMVGEVLFKIRVVDVENSFFAARIHRPEVTAEVMPDRDFLPISPGAAGVVKFD